MTCPECEYHKQRAALWRHEAYRLAGTPLPWDADEAIAKAVAAEREALAAWMTAHGFATGHGDTIGDMLNALAWQIDERVAMVIQTERERCAKLVEDKFDFCGDELLIAEAIRARGEE